MAGGTVTELGCQVLAYADDSRLLS